MLPSVHRRRALKLGFAAAVTAIGFAGVAQAQTTLLNVSYDPTREFYQEFNTAFIKHWTEKTGETLSIKQSHGGLPSRRALSSTAWRPMW